ncbi:cytoplasmic polyadenylation element-binding protein 2-like isoform X2 [Symsagittifera roscoffensis]|uniref:cytoplasmic polyadenylation element-binding protein 2-like isoform X2 n=1 Tax=Symsagittifera roscoffensis TaxID=84072 RepID=UPI00307C3A75
MVIPEESQFPPQNQQQVDIPKHPMNGISANVTGSLNDVQNVDNLNQADEINGGVKPIIDQTNDFAINGDVSQAPPQQQPQQQPPMMQKPMFDMPEQNMPFAQMFPPDFNMPQMSAGMNNGPQMGAQPPFWSNSQPPSAPTEDFYNFAPPSMNGNFPSFPPNMAAPTAQSLNAVFNQNFMNLPPPHLALNPPNRRSPAGSVYNPSFPPRQAPNMYPMKNFGQSNGWANNNQTPWNALTPSPWNQLQKRGDARHPGFDPMRFGQLESSLLDIMRNEMQPDMRPRRNHPFFLDANDLDDSLGAVAAGHYNPNDPMMANQMSAMGHMGRQGQCPERFSRKVFVGGLPPDIDEDEITQTFRRFGPLVVDWPHKAESKSYFPPKGYAFLLFQEEASVQALIDQSVKDDGKLYICVSSPTIKDKAVQIRPWNLADSDYVMDGSQPLDPRKTIFVGGVPRPLKAQELARIMDRLYGGVCYAGIDTDPELKYPKGAGRVAFANQQSYIAAISARFVQLQHGDIDKRVEVKPYVLDDQMCDECHGNRCNGKYAPYFCANVMCLQYYCDQCWSQIHSRQGREYHKPLVKEGGERSRGGGGAGGGGGGANAYQPGNPSHARWG